MFYIEDNSYAGLWVVDPEQQSKIMTIRGEELTIHANGSQTIMKLSAGEQLVLQFAFSPDGTVGVQDSVVNQ